MECSVIGWEGSHHVVVGGGGKGEMGKEKDMHEITTEECEEDSISHSNPLSLPSFSLFPSLPSFFLLQPLHSLMQAEAASDPRDLNRPHCWHVRGNEEGGEEQQGRDQPDLHLC